MHGWSPTLDQQPLSFKAFVRALQFGLHYALPYFVVSQLWRVTGMQFPWMLAVGIEFAFYMWMAAIRLPYLHAQPLVIDPPGEPPMQIWKTSMERVEIAASLGYPLKKWLSGWFLGADPAQIKYDNFTEWISHMFFARELSSLDSCSRSEVDAMAQDLCARLGLSPEPGYNDSVHSIRFLHEPLFILQRSLLQYVCTSMVPRLAVGVLFSAIGLRRACCTKTGLYYWWRAPSSSGDNIVGDVQPDLLFLHGLCGFTGYVPMLMMLLWRSSRGAVLLELEDISQCLNQARWPTRKAVVETARSAMDRLQLERSGFRRSCIIMSHSLGTGAAACILEDPPAEVVASVFIDPIVIMLEMPDVAHSFLYRSPSSVFEWLCFLWCATEPGIAFFFRRRFFWHHSRLQPSICKRVPTLLCLSEHDQIVPSNIVRAFASQAMPSAEIKWWQGLGHTYFMGSPFCQSEVVRWVMKWTVSSDENGGIQLQSLRGG